MLTSYASRSGVEKTTSANESVAKSAPTVVRQKRSVWFYSFIPNAAGIAAFIRGLESIGNNATKQAPAANKSADQRPVSNDGSYWVPARIDLDTALSKIDSRLVEEITFIRGPYSSRYGPGFIHTDVDLVGAPRFKNGYESHGEIGGGYESNGNQWSGFKSIWGGGESTGFRFDYAHRGGGDYETGGSEEIPGDYETRTFAFAFGHDFNDDHSIELQLLRLDQFDVDLAGQAFDIDRLSTNGADLEYVWRNRQNFDELVIDLWYNDTQLAGNAQSAEKRRFFPSFNNIGFIGDTDVESKSAGYRAEASWIGDDWTFTAGSDLRFIEQELREISSGTTTPRLPWTDRNSPIPLSHTANPGLFFDYVEAIDSSLDVKIGARVDWFTAQVDEDAANLADDIGSNTLPYTDIVGSTELETNEVLWAAYVSADKKLTDNMTATIAIGHAQRPPNLTELYAAEPFMFLIQSGQNIVTGDPLLSPERLWQVDGEIRYESQQISGRLRGYHKWIDDYITFENMGQSLEQTSLKFVNTKRATIAGFDFDVEHKTAPWLTSFSTLSYAEGRDRTRNGTFATNPSSSFPVDRPSERRPGFPRGTASGVDGTDSEPLPGMLPLSVTFGLRLHSRECASSCGEEVSRSGDWNVELSGRYVAQQDRVASSLGELPTGEFTTFDLRSIWRINETIILIGGVENITDEDYRQHFDFRSPTISVNQPGRSFYVGSEIRF